MTFIIILSEGTKHRIREIKSHIKRKFPQAKVNINETLGEIRVEISQNKEKELRRTLNKRNLPNYTLISEPANVTTPNVLQTQPISYIERALNMIAHIEDSLKKGQFPQLRSDEAANIFLHGSEEYLSLKKDSEELKVLSEEKKNLKKELDHYKQFDEQFTQLTSKVEHLTGENTKLKEELKKYEELEEISKSTTDQLSQLEKKIKEKQAYISTLEKERNEALKYKLYAKKYTKVRERIKAILEDLGLEYKYKAKKVESTVKKEKDRLTDFLYHIHKNPGQKIETLYKGYHKRSMGERVRLKNQLVKEGLVTEAITQKGGPHYLKLTQKGYGLLKKCGYEFYKLEPQMLNRTELAEQRKNAVLEAIGQGYNSPKKIREVMKARGYSVNRKTLVSILGTAVKRGEIERIRRGVYRILKP